MSHFPTRSQVLYSKGIFLEREQGSKVQKSRNVGGNCDFQYSLSYLSAVFPFSSALSNWSDVSRDIFIQQQKKLLSAADVCGWADYLFLCADAFFRNLQNDVITTSSDTASDKHSSKDSGEESGSASSDNGSQKRDDTTPGEGQGCMERNVALTVRSSDDDLSVHEVRVHMCSPSSSLVERLDISRRLCS